MFLINNVQQRQGSLQSKHTTTRIKGSMPYKDATMEIAQVVLPFFWTAKNKAMFSYQGMFNREGMFSNIKNKLAIRSFDAQGAWQSLLRCGK